MRRPQSVNLMIPSWFVCLINSCIFLVRFRPCWFIHDWLCLPLCVLQTVRTIRRRRCYPPTWKRWVFFLFPGTTIATSAVALYAFVETEEKLLLHPQHLAHAHRRERRLPSAATCQNLTWKSLPWRGGEAAATSSVWTSTRRWDWWTLRSLPSQHMHQLMMLSNMDFYLPFFSFLWIIKNTENKARKLTDAL